MICGSHFYHLNSQDLLTTSCEALHPGSPHTTSLEVLFILCLTKSQRGSNAQVRGRDGGETQVCEAPASELLNPILYIFVGKRNQTLFSAIQGSLGSFREKTYCPYLEFQPGMRFLKQHLKQSVFSLAQDHGLGFYLCCSWTRVWSHDEVAFVYLALASP